MLHDLLIRLHRLLIVRKTIRLRLFMLIIAIGTSS
jgi:hypothetical protein